MKKIDTKLHIQVVTALTEKIAELQADLDFFKKRNDELFQENSNLECRLENLIQDNEYRSFSKERNLEDQLHSIKNQMADAKIIVDEFNRVNERIFAEYEAANGKLFSENEDPHLMKVVKTAFIQAANSTGSHLTTASIKSVLDFLESNKDLPNIDSVKNIRNTYSLGLRDAKWVHDWFKAKTPAVTTYTVTAHVVTTS